MKVLWELFDEEYNEKLKMSGMGRDMEINLGKI